jgi:hypothetical protein
MNAVNRVIVVVLLLVIGLLCTITLLFPVRVLDAVARQPSALADLLRQYERYSPEWFVRVSLGGLFALAIDIIVVLLLILELRRPKPKFIHVEKAAGGEVQVSVSSIADRLNYEVNALADVLRVKTKVSAKRRGVVVELNVQTTAGLDVPDKADQIVETAQRVVEEGLGLKMARSPKVNLRAAPFPKMPTKPPKAPAPPREIPPASLFPEEPSGPIVLDEWPPVLPEDEADGA